MKSFRAITLTLAASFAASVFGLSITDLPACSNDCTTTSFASTGSCGSTDIKCICSTKSFVTSIASCVEKACPPSDVQKTLDVATSLCQQAGATLDQGLIASITASASSAASTGGSSSSNGTTNGTSVSTTAPPSANATGAAAVVGVSGITIGGALAAFFLL